MEEKLVSVIAPAYNHHQYIEKCLYSIIDQTYENIELIIIDDNSPDNTTEIIEEIINKKFIKNRFNGNIKFLKHKENMGAHNSINQGLSLAAGQYLTIVNTDDMYEKNRFTLMINQMEKTNSQFSFSKVDTINDEGEILHNEESEYFKSVQNKLYMYPFTSLAIVTDNIAISTGNFLFTKSLFDKVGKFMDYKYIHDWDFFLRSSLVTEPIYIHETDYFYRLHSENSFKKLQNDVALCYNESMNVLTNYFKKIIDKEYVNQNIPNIEVWEYFLTYIIKNPDILHIWNLAKNVGTVKTY